MFGSSIPCSLFKLLICEDTDLRKYLMWVVTLVLNSAMITSFKAALNMEASVGTPFRMEN